MPKSPWKECSCGITTDPDEEECPVRGLKDNPKHQLKPVNLSDEELMIRRGKGEVYTKDYSRFLGLIIDKSPP